MVRPTVSQFVSLGAFPDSKDVLPQIIANQETLLRAIEPPISDAEAVELVKLFGPDDYFGLAWTLLHLIETAPHWPLRDCLRDTSNEWIALLSRRVENLPES